MRENESKDIQQTDETVLDFETAKDMTVGEAVRAHKDLKAGISPEDGLLDRYIKQHRQDIEANKFDLIEETESLSDEPDMEELGIHKVIPEDTKVEEIQEAVAVESLVTDEFLDPETADFNDVDDTESKKKLWLWGGAAVTLVAIVTGFFVFFQTNQSSTTDTSSSSSTSTTTTTTTSSSADEAAVAAFETLYKSFFTDATMSELKNSEFEKLSELKAALDKINSQSSSYADAKAKYDQLEKAIQALQTLNGQFDKPVVVDGEIDTTATVRAGVALTATTTGISGVDTTISSAVNFGISQQDNATSVANPVASVTSGDASSATIVPTQETTETLVPTTTISNVVIGGTATSPAIYGIAIPAGVTLQRELSRVPYDQTKIDDSSNEAWNFNPGILEKIVATSQERGYITGNQYILERVNIINGNGYYNMFKPDGTYLFSLNAKTGYFVGNASGHADALDY